MLEEKLTQLLYGSQFKLTQPKHSIVSSTHRRNALCLYSLSAIAGLNPRVFKRIHRMGKVLVPQIPDTVVRSTLFFVPKMASSSFRKP